MKGMIDDKTLGAIANALRSKTGTDELILPHNMNTMIENIPTGKSLTLLAPQKEVDNAFQLYAVLTNIHGEPLAGETITLDGTEYSSVTDEKGIAVFNISGITEDTTFTAVYEDLTSSVTVESYLFIDYGYTGKKNGDWLTSNYGILTSEVTSEGTVLTYPTNLSSGWSGYLANVTMSGDFTVYCDFNPRNSIAQDYIQLRSSSNLNKYLSMSSNSFSASTRKFTTIKIEYTSSSVKRYYLKDDGTYQLVGTDSHTDPYDQFLFLIANNTSDGLIFKNLKIKKGVE